MAGFSIVTNINSLIAQENLGKTNFAQQRTIQRLTSGLRINSSADDAAGLAVANRFRSDVAVLQQGVRNAADGLSALQTIDGGLNNISLLLDRGRTLATQSASGTFTGDRNALNSEFQSVIEEINRQAQSIGLDPGGQFNAALQVFIGGGRANNGISETANGAVSIDLTDAAVSGSRLGLEGVRALGGVEGTTDIGSTSTTSVENIVGNAANQASQTTVGFSEFVFSGPGFADDGKAKLSVNLAGVVDSSTLATAINDAIAGFSSTSAAGEAFKNAGIQAVINTDTNGGKQLAFTSSDTAFQVKAGDLTANALLGNYVNSATGAEGASLTLRALGGLASGDASVSNTDTIVLKVAGGALTTPQTVSITLTGSETQAQVFSALETAFNDNATLAGSGFRIVTDTAADTVEVFNDNGDKFSVLVSGDSENLLGFGSAVLGAGSAPTASTYSGGGAIDVSVSGTASIYVLVEGSGALTPQQIDVAVTAGVTTQQDVIDQINAAINTDSTLSAAGLKATLGAGNVLELASASGTTFQLSVDDSNANNILQLGDAGGGVVDGAALAAGTNFGSAGANIAGVSVALDYDGIAGTDATIEATLNEGYVGGAVTAADAGETITFTITNNRTGVTTATITVNVLNTDDSDDLETSIGAAIDAALGANILEITNGAGGAAAALEFAVGASANDADSFTINNFTATTNGAFDSGIVNGTSISLDAVTETRLADKLNAAVTVNSAVAATGLRFIADTVNGTVDVTAAQDLSFTATNTATGSNIGDFVSGLATVSTDITGGGLLTGFSSVEQGTFVESTVNSGGAQSTSGATVDDPSTFQALAYGNDLQNLSVAVKDPSGAVQTLNIALNHANALTIDEAVNAINDQLQQSNNSTLQGLLAVKERIDGSTDGIRLLGGADTEFSLNASGLATGNGLNGGTAQTLKSAALEGGSVADISSRENAENAVTLLASAVSILGTLQANVGRGQNRLQYAIGLATTQITNISAAESRIRDADLASEAANLTRTTIAQQAGVAALAQANSAPQAVLALLRG